MLVKMTKKIIYNKYVNVIVISLTLLPSVLLAVLFIPVVLSLYPLTPFLEEETDESMVFQYNLFLMQYPTGILKGKYIITGIRDLTTGYDNTKPDNKAILPVSKSSQMITFTFKNGLVTTLRTSGTEPKIKYYNELCGSPGEDLNKLKCILSEMVSAIVAEFLQPEVNGLIAREE